MFGISWKKVNSARASAALIICAALALSTSACAVSPEESLRVDRGDKGTFIVDRTGNRWDITQAVSVGFRPERFQYGLGKDAFAPLDDSSLVDGSAESRPDLRVIGVSGKTAAQAYSVPKLTRHEIANSYLGADPIAVGY